MGSRILARVAEGASPMEMLSTMVFLQMKGRKLQDGSLLVRNGVITPINGMAKSTTTKTMQKTQTNRMLQIITRTDVHSCGSTTQQPHYHFTKATFPFLKQLPPPIVMWGFELEMFDVFAVKAEK